MPSHPNVQPLIEPHPDTSLMKLVLAGCRDHFFGLLLQSLLADAAVSLIGELETTLDELKRLHELFESFLLSLAPFNGGVVVLVCSIARLSLSAIFYSEAKTAALHLAALEYTVKDTTKCDDKSRRAQDHNQHHQAQSSLLCH